MNFDRKEKVNGQKSDGGRERKGRVRLEKG